MILDDAILKRYSKTDALKIVRWVGGSEQRFTELIKRFEAADEYEALRCIWIISMCAEAHPTLALPWLPKLVKHTGAKDAHDAIKRNIIRTLQFVKIPRRLQGRVADLCFGFIQDVKAPIAVKVFSMTVLANIAKDEPDLKQEIRLVIEQMLPYGSAAIRSRAKRVLKQLSN